jgi:hypothetical protein
MGFFIAFEVAAPFKAWQLEFENYFASLVEKNYTFNRC